MDLSHYNVKQLKEIIRNYNLHYHIKDYYKKSRPELEGIIHDYMEYVNDKIYNKKHVEVSKPKEDVKKVIAATEIFFQQLGVPTKLCDYQLGPEVVTKIVDRFASRGFEPVGETGAVTLTKVREVLQGALI